MKGWKYEGYRHALAARGISTRKRFMGHYSDLTGQEYDSVIDKGMAEKVFKKKIEQNTDDIIDNDIVDIPGMDIPRESGLTEEEIKESDPKWIKQVDRLKEFGTSGDKFREYRDEQNKRRSIKRILGGSYPGNFGNVSGDDERSAFYAKKVAIPPAWTNVKHHKDKEYIVTGVDEKGRTQYIYPKSHSARRSMQKHSRIDRLAKRLPSIMKSVKRDIDSGNNPEAEVVYMMYKTGFRPGTDKDTMADKKAYGASNLLRDQVSVNGNTVHFKFIGKKGVLIDKKITDSRLANIVKSRLGSRRLFDTSETRLRRYFQQKTGGAYQLKDLRTHKAFEVAKKTKGTNKEIVAKVAEELVNTPAVAKGSYINPGILEE